MIHFDDRFIQIPWGKQMFNLFVGLGVNPQFCSGLQGGPSRLQVIIQFAPFRLWGCYGCFVKGLGYGRAFELFLNLRQKINVFDFSLIHTNGHFFHPLILGKQKSTRVPHRNLRLNLLEVNLGQEEPPVAHRFP